MTDTSVHEALGRVIAVINGKGGAGKTSIAANVGGLLAASGYSVLLVDLDPQGNLAEDLGYGGTERDDDGLALAQTLAFGGALAPVRGVREDLDVAPGGFHLDAAAASLAAQANKDRDRARGALANALAPVAAGYDVVLLDCPPGNESLQLVAVAAARWALIPAKTDASSIKGMRDVARRLDGVVDINPRLDLLGVVLFAVGASATNVVKEARAAMAAELGSEDLVFTSTIRHAEATAQATRRRGVLVHELEQQVRQAPAWWQLRRGMADTGAPRMRSAISVADDFEALTREVVERIEAGEKAAEA